MRTWNWLIVCLALALVMACGSKGDSPSEPTLVPTLAPPVAGATDAATAIPTLLAPTATTTPTPTPSPTPTEVPLAARVNGQPIYLAEYEQEVMRAGDAVTASQVLDAMIETALLEQAAAEAGISVSDEQLDALIQADIEAVGGREVFDQRLAANGLSEEEYRERVRANLIAQRVQMQLPGEVADTLEHVHARHILVATQEEAEAILAQLREGSDFDTLARTYSLDVSTRDRGGDLGFFPRGLLLAPELEETAFSLDPGQISEVIQSELLGYHIVQVLEREERPVGEQEKELIQANQIRRWRENLWAQAAVERFVEP